MVSLVDWHRRIHGVTGAMALRWCQATAEDLAEWARELRAVAEAMEAAAAQPPSRVAVNAHSRGRASNGTGSGAGVNRPGSAGP